MEQRYESKLLTIFSGELWKATMIQNILQDNNIFAHLKNELTSTIQPWAVTPGGYNPAEVLVSRKDYERTMKLLVEFNNSEPDLLN